MPKPARTRAPGTCRQPKAVLRPTCQYGHCPQPATAELVMWDGEGRLRVCREHEDINLVEYLQRELCKE